MPELPEVETVRLSLLPYLPGKTIQSVVIRDPHVIQEPNFERYPELLGGQSITSLERIGKQLIFVLEESYLLIHLGMTGQLTYRDPNRQDTKFHRHHKTGLQRTLQHPVDKHTHISLEFPDSTALHYRDIRKFGKWRLVDRSTNVSQHLKLGVDPLTSGFDPEFLWKGLKKSKRPVKARLLDQSFIAGLGNIYVDEALFDSGIRPGRGSHRITRKESLALAGSILKVLRLGLKNGGTTLQDFQDGEGQSGYNQECLLVYGRYGEPCPRCKKNLRRSEVGGRTSSWCAICQK